MNFGVQVGSPISQLSMCTYLNVVPASGPASSMSFAAVSAKCRSMASALMGSISHAGGFGAERALVRMESSPFSTSYCGTMKPIRRTLHVPFGTFQRRRPPFI